MSNPVFDPAVFDPALFAGTAQVFDSAVFDQALFDSVDAGVSLALAGQAATFAAGALAVAGPAVTPTNTTYAPAPSPFTAGRFVPSASGLDALLDTIAARPASSWTKLNVNRFDDAWLPEDLRNEVDANRTGAIIHAYGGMVWDWVNHRIILFGGGHADSSCNEPYFFDATRGLWRLAYLPSLRDGALARSVDGNASPVSLHPYNNGVFLAASGRYMVVGGSTAPGGDSGPGVWDEANPASTTPLRSSGAFSLDMRRAGLGFVGGKTGAHSHRGAYAGVNFHGAEAWRLHDWHKNANPASTNRLDAGAVAAVEGGRDVVYVLPGAGIDRNLARVELVDANPANDLITLAAASTTGTSLGVGAADIDQAGGVLLSLCNQGSDPRLFFADFKRTAGSNYQLVNAAGLANSTAMLAATTKETGLAFDTRRGVWVVNNGNDQVWEITMPSGNPTPTTGWNVTTPTMAAGAAPVSSELVFGKFQYARDLGCCVLLQDQYAGNVWAYKPAGWTDPRI